MAFDPKRLYDVLTRHQIYLEGVKASFSEQFNETLKELAQELIVLFATLEYASLDQMTKRALSQFLFKLRQTQSRIYGEYNERLLEQLKILMIADIRVTKILLASLVNDNDEAITERYADMLMAQAEDEDDNKLFPLIWFTRNTEKLWSAITNAPVPANGILPLTFLSNFQKSAQVRIENAVRKGYVNAQTKEELLNEIIGTKQKNYKDGQLDSIHSQERAAVSTVIQHQSSIIQAGLGSFFVGKYMWVSVIDSVTTEICRSRNKNVYEYGKGPLPPAHIR